MASQPCLVCGRQPSDPHHLRFAQPRALGLKVSDEFTVPLCRGHHRQLHQAGNEVAWWENLNINAAGDRQGTMGANASKICGCRYASTHEMSPRPRLKADGDAQQSQIGNRPDKHRTMPTALCHSNDKTKPICCDRSMSSLKQIEANRRNALKSTGPTTPEGKERSRRNAVRHGLTAETVIAALEDAEDYQAFEAAVIADYDAESAVERELVLRLASVLWRLRRATGIETALFESVTSRTGKVEHRSHWPNSRLRQPICRIKINYTLSPHGNLTRQRQTSSVPIRKRISATASCAWPLCRLSP